MEQCIKEECDNSSADKLHAITESRKHQNYKCKALHILQSKHLLQYSYESRILLGHYALLQKVVKNPRLWQSSCS